MWRTTLVACLTYVITAAAQAEVPQRLERQRAADRSSVAAPQTRNRDRSSPGVYKTRISPHWFADGQFFWYRNDLPDGVTEFILVDAGKGERKRAFDHDRLAQALAEAGVAGAAADRLKLETLEFDLAAGTISFRSDGKDWRCHLETYELVQIAERDVASGGTNTAIHPDDVPRASTRTGPETEIRFVNQTDATVQLFWLDGGGSRRSYGPLAAGATKDQHTYAGHVWLAVDASGAVIAAFQAQDQPSRAVIARGQVARRSRRGGRRWDRSSDNNTSPDGRWQALTREGNLFVRAAGGQVGSDELQLSEDGTPENGYQMLQWSPDSQTLIAFRVDPGDRKEVFLVESSPRGGGRAVLHQRPYALPGDKFTSYELRLFRLTTNEPAQGQEEGGDQDSWREIELNAEPIDFGRPRLRWNADGSAFYYTKIDRGHQRLRVIRVDVETGQSRNAIDERTDTFIWTAHTENLGLRPINWLDNTGEILLVSEVDGWRHLYLVDPEAGAKDTTATPAITNGGKYLVAPGLKQQITKGQFVVRGVDRIDQERRQVWFRASGMNSEQDPYLTHYYRVDFDGTKLVRLTAGNGEHSIQFSPDRRYIIDTFSRVDLPPVHQLRRSDDGGLVCQLEEADITELEQSGWQPPEVFVATGRDGETDIWGIICRPRDLDPGKKYPVIEDIYAGPQSSFVPKTFSARDRYSSLTELGFIVVKIDGMGTANRSKAFHDVCWHNLKDAGFPDRILWIKAAAERYPYIDLTRVGVYGGSAGGQSAAGALLFHNEFYKVAVAGCGCHDNRMDKASWNEQWMGYPVGSHYSDNSNIDNAYRLEGALLLIVGEMDQNVPPESTLRLADALIKADKDFDLIVVPGAGHGMGGAYGRRRMHDFFVEHLLDKAAPARTAAAAGDTVGRESAHETGDGMSPIP